MDKSSTFVSRWPIELILRLFLIIVLLSSFMKGLNAQDIQTISADARYYSAIGEGSVLDEAKQNALVALSQQIMVRVQDISTQQRLNNQEQFGYQTQIFTNATLTNVEECMVSDAPNAKVFCYVLKSDVEKMLKEKSDKILDLVEIGKKAERNLQIDDALRNYYWALLLAKNHLKNVEVEFDGRKSMALNVLPDKIKSVVSRIQVYVEDGEMEGNHVKVRLHFSYNGNNVSSVAFRYNDGNSIVGPVKARDGVGEVDLVSVSADGKLHLSYEVRFMDEARTLDPEMAALFSMQGLPIINASCEVPVKVNSRKKEVMGGKPVLTNEQPSIAAESIKDKIPITMHSASDADSYKRVLTRVEKAISDGDAMSVSDCFEDVGADLFRRMLASGKVTLVGKQQRYEFIEADGEVWARHCAIKVTHRNGRAFMENVVFRFNPSSKKITSLAYTLTKRGENDIMNAASSWPEVSRYTILRFMEDYQTAFALKRLDYIEKIYSDDALIITGVVLKTAPQQEKWREKGVTLTMKDSDPRIQYNKYTKEGYLKKLRSTFQQRDYVHLTFEDNLTRKIATSTNARDGAAFGIQIRQLYNTPIYSDEGYLTLILDNTGIVPIINVRFWQPNKSEIIDLESFINKFNF